MVEGALRLPAPVVVVEGPLCLPAAVVEDLSHFGVFWSLCAISSLLFHI